VSIFQSDKGGTIMKSIGALIAAVAALTLSGGAFAQAAGGSNGGGSAGSTASPANQVNGGGTGGYGTPGMTNSDSGMSNRGQTSGLPSSVQGNQTTQPAPTSNNTLATPSVKSPVSQ
jgi:hypothetical protein